MFYARLVAGGAGEEGESFVNILKRKFTMEIKNSSFLFASSDFHKDFADFGDLV